MAKRRFSRALAPSPRRAQQAAFQADDQPLPGSPRCSRTTRAAWAAPPSGASRSHGPGKGPRAPRCGDGSSPSRPNPRAIPGDCRGGRCASARAWPSPRALSTGSPRRRPGSWPPRRPAPKRASRMRMSMVEPAQMEVVVMKVVISSKNGVCARHGREVLRRSRGIGHEPAVSRVGDEEIEEELGAALQDGIASPSGRPCRR